MEMISTDCKDGNGIKVRGLLGICYILTENITVFGKEEIVFARTSPKHKLEIGELAVLRRRFSS